MRTGAIATMSRPRPATTKDRPWARPPRQRPSTSRTGSAASPTAAWPSGRARCSTRPPVSVSGLVDFATAAVMDEAVAAAKEAFADWRDSSLSRRTQVLFAFRELLNERKEEIAALITAEHGKVLSDALGEVTRGLEVVEFACGIPHLLKGGFSEGVSTKVDVYSIRQPLGVVGIISPFNFPAMVPMWFFPIAIACGNTVVVKPSEKDPSRRQLRRRAVGRGRSARRRVQRRARRQGGRRPAARPPRRQEHLVRRLDPDRPLRLRDRDPGTASGSRRSAARRTTWSSCPTPTSTSPPTPRSTPASARRGSAAWRSRRSSSSSRSPTSWSARSPSGSAPCAPATAAAAPTWARWSPRCTATRSSATSRPASTRARPSSSTVATSTRTEQRAASGSARRCSTTSRPT